MDISAALVLKIIGGFMVGTAHRTIARAAKEESTSWWLVAMFVPGGSIVYGLRRAQEFLIVVLIMFGGFLVLGTGVGLHFHQQWKEAARMAAADGAFEEAEPGEDEEMEDGEYTAIPATPVSFTEPAKPQTATAPQSFAITPAAVKSTETRSSTTALPALTDVPKRLQPKLKKLMERYQALSKERARLDPRNEDAVRAFNLRAEDYQAACRQFRAELAD